MSTISSSNEEQTASEAQMRSSRRGDPNEGVSSVVSEDNVGEAEEQQATPERDVEDEEVETTESRRRLQMRLLQFLQTGGIYGIVRSIDADDDDDNEFDDDYHDNDENENEVFWDQSWRRMLPPSHSVDQDRFPKVPSEEGAELMNSGNFGLNTAEANTSIDKSNIGKKTKIAMRIFNRELAIESPVRQKISQKLMKQELIPSSVADMIIQFENPVYSGQFSDDGNFFFAVNKDFKVRMYDTSNPYNWRYYKTVSYPSGRWTLTDASLSPDNKYLAYTSIHSNVCLAPTDPNDVGDPYILDLSHQEDRNSARGRSGFGIWSIRYSGDGRNLVAGTTGGLIVVYDIECRRHIHQIYGHDEDVNAVCLADRSSPHILYSGSDDTTLKVWDTRSMGDSRAAGTFIGHIEGLTYVDSKGDGRYILSNGKDQSTKLWDVRMAMSPQQYEQLTNNRRPTRGYFDYRFGKYDDKFWYRDPRDNSLVTYRGHRVLKTLIRCHFSPPGSTNSRYIYSGSQDGKVYIWNLDATIAGVIDVYKSTSDPHTSRLRGHLDPEAFTRIYDGEEWSTCVRDASWHPTAPIIVASAWNGYGTRSGTCTLHSWNDDVEGDETEPCKEIRLDERLNKILDF
ncbi:LEC14B-like protein [Erysiphe neolycopersici]|uniref:LEC14B-like protein n=1 Tax=Erysiphe neolycopersici TaxID=212602 RepID=A0A420HXN9_9PEZI|nr:LEC14B-like protein [Erysiphe neolycopersici]